MKKYSVIALFILVLITISVFTYFFFLDIVYDNKVATEELRELRDLKSRVESPIARYADAKELQAAQGDYAALLQELGVQGGCRIEKENLLIEGVIDDNADYLLLKRLLGVIQNDRVSVQSSCIGKGCVQYSYGYKIVFRPYVLNNF